MLLSLSVNAEPVSALPNWDTYQVEASIDLITTVDTTVQTRQLYNVTGENTQPSYHGHKLIASDNKHILETGWQSA